MDINYLDLVTLFILLISIFLGLIRGFVKETISLISWIVAFIVGYNFYQVIANLLSSLIHSQVLRTIIAFGLIFVVCIIGFSILSAILVKGLQKLGLRGVDKILGLVFGFLRGIFVIAMLVAIVDCTPFKDSDYYVNSRTLEYITPVKNWILETIPLSNVPKESQKLSY